MFRYFLMLVFIVCCASCDSGRKGSKGGNQSSTPIDAGKKFKIGGSVLGLNGNIAIANGDDTVTVAADGGFIFAKPVNEGELYNVKIIALPQNQLCELRNSKNYAYRDHYDIGIECANLLERNIRISLPSTIKLNELRLMSNYQAKGGQGEEQLSDLVTKMMVFDNSVVSLRNAENKVLFLTYLSNLAAEEFELSSKTTAIALMLLEPTVVSALQDRGLVTGQFVDQLVSAVNSNGDIDLLATEIQNLIAKKGSLSLPTTELNASLGRVLDSAIRIIVKDSVLSTKHQTNIASNSTTAQRKLSVVSSSDALGVVFSFVKTTDGTGTLNFSTTNKNARYVSLLSEKFSPLSLPPYGDKKFEVKSALGSQGSFSVVIVGPGTLGTLSSEANMKSALAATITSGVSQYFVPSLNVLLGLKSPAGFRVADCLAEETITALDSKSAAQPNALKALGDDKYYQLLTTVSFNARNQFVTGTNNKNQSPIEELFSCEKFGVGVLIANKKAIAIENTAGILTALNGAFNPVNIPQSLNLFAPLNVSFLTEAIRNSYAERTWVLSSVLQFDVNASRTQILAGDTVQFTSSCKDPSNGNLIACDVTWNFGDGDTITGNLVSHKYLKTGSYTVTATAKDIDGAQQTQTINIDVLTFSQENTAFGSWTVKQNGSEKVLSSVRAKTFFDDENDLFQIRLFAAPQQDNPQISLSIKGFDFNTNTRGDGVYSLADTSSGETCLGFYGDDATPTGTVFCTSTTGRASTQPFSGTVTVSTESDADIKKAVFTFNAFDVACTKDILACDNIQVSGEVLFSSGL
jgi:hypothetical protein